MSRLAEALERAGAQSVAAAPMPPASTAPPRWQPGSSAPLLVEARALPPERHWQTHPEFAGKLAGTPDFPPAALEQYRKLAAMLYAARDERPRQVLSIVSSIGGEGKSLTTANLALTLAGSYKRRVLIIDADLRRPTIHRLFGIPHVTGLSEALRDGPEHPAPIVSVTERLYVVPAGRPNPDPLSGLASERMRRLIAESRANFDSVVIDTPPSALLPDANLLSGNIDGAVLVIRAGTAPYHLVKRTADLIGPDRILGVVLNAVDAASDGHAGGYSEYYGRAAKG